MGANEAVAPTSPRLDLVISANSMRKLGQLGGVTQRVGCQSESNYSWLLLVHLYWMTQTYSD